MDYQVPVEAIGVREHPSARDPRPSTAFTVHDDGRLPQVCIAVSGRAARAIMFVLGKRGAASSMCETIAASTSSFASRCFWPLHATTAGEWMSTNPEAERYSTMVWVDTQLHAA
jgi:hypothetical protein